MNRSVMERQMFKDGGAAFPDLSGDGKITQKDILMGRGVQFMENGGPPVAATGDVLSIELLKRFNLLKQDQSPDGLAKLRAFAVNTGDPRIIAEVEALLGTPLRDSPEIMELRRRAEDQNRLNELNMMGLGAAAMGAAPSPMAPFETGRGAVPMAPPETGRERIPMAPSEMEMMLEELRRRAEDQMSRDRERMNNLPIGKQEGGVIEPPMMDPAMMAGGSPAQMMMAEQQVMDAPPEIQQAAAEEIQAGLPMVENALNQFAMNTGGKDVEDAETFEEMMNMVRGFPATTGERREELAELVGPEDASQTPDSVLAMVQPIIGLTALDQGIGSLAREEMGEAPPMGGIMDMAAAPGGMMVEENMPV